MQTVKGKADNPKDPVSARFLNLKKTQKQIEARGLTVLSIGQEWRHVHAKVLQDGEERFLKLASTKGISRATRNEATWNKHLADNLSHKSPFKVPRIHATGLLEGKFFYVSDYVSGKQLCQSKLKANTRALRSRINEVTETLLRISSLPRRSFVWDRTYRRLKHPGKKYFGRALSFYKASEQKRGKEIDLSELLIAAQGVEEYYRPALAHADFTPWHILVNREQELILTDAEWSTSLLPAHYDLAYCYHRLCTCSGAFIAADKLLESYYQQLTKRKRNRFAAEFLPILAERIIGGYWDALCGQNSAAGQLRAHKRLKNKFIRSEIL